MIGTTIGQYRIESEAGAGGMGVVYRAVDVDLKRPVAIKILNAAALADPDRKRRFVQEAQAASALNHPDIVTIYQIGTDGQTDFIAMEFVAGRSLDDVIALSGYVLSQEGRAPVAFSIVFNHVAGKGAAARAALNRNKLRSIRINISCFDWCQSFRLNRLKTGEFDPGSE